MDASASMSPPMDDAHANATSSVSTYTEESHAPLLPTAALPGLAVPLTAAALPNASFNHSSLIYTSSSMPPMDGVHTNAT